MNLLAPVWTHLTEHQVVKGEGLWLHTSDDKKLLDFTSGIGVTNTGHCHPRIVERIQKESSKLIFGQMNCVIPQNAILLAEKLNEITPSHINRFFFANSGAEATEAAVKLAKHGTGKKNVIVFQGSFHGRTHLTMAMTTSKTVYRYNYQPLPAGIFVSPFPHTYYYELGEEETVEFCLKQLDLVLQGQSDPNETAAIVIEPILGEGGYIPAPESFLKALRKVCDQHQILLIIDEVQSGFGRTGKMFCFEYSNVKPDIIIMAKGLGSGMPISAIASSDELMDRWLPGTHGGTFGGGNAIITGVACETIDVLKEESLIENAAEKGEKLITALQELKIKYPIVGDVRGKGLMLATEFTSRDGKPDSQSCSLVLRECLASNLLMLSCGTYKNVLRWIPPLVVNEEELELALSIFEKALKKVGTNLD